MRRRGERYRHYKGNEYIISGIINNADTLEDVVVYRSADLGTPSCLTLNDFFKEVEHEGNMVKRFERIN